MILGGIGCPVSPPVSAGFGFAMVGGLSLPQLDVVVGFEISPSNIKSRFNIVLKI